MIMKKVLLINPPLFFIDGQPKNLDISAPPLGILYLASYINYYSENIKAEILDIGAEKLNLSGLKHRLKTNKPDAIGISSMTPQLQGTIEIAKLIKETHSDLPIFLGGPHISADKNFIIRHETLFDYAITGEAEKTFLKTLEKLFNGNFIPKIQESDIILNLDEIPIPDMSLINKNNYKKTSSMLFSRGCPFKCYYCSRPAISNKVRYRTTKNMISEIKKRCTSRENCINFQDDTFTMIREKVMDFCNEILKEKIVIQWECNTRIDLVDDELLKTMKKAGCAQINFGIESGSERVRRDIINKGTFTNKKITDIFALCKKHKIKIAGYFMIGHPTETKKEIRETRELILKSGIDVLGLSIPLPFPGSLLYDIAKKEKIINEEIIDCFAEKKLGEGYTGIYPIYRSKTLPAKYIFHEMKTINRLFYLKPKIILLKIMEDLQSPSKFKTDLKDFISLIIQGTSSRKPYKIKK